MRWPADHPERFALAEEVHARPPEAIEAPSRLTYLAVLVDPDQRVREREHLQWLCEKFVIAAPTPEATHFSARFGAVRLKWERHGEFSAYTLIASAAHGGEAGGPAPFAQNAAELLPDGWLSDVPGITIMSGHALLLAGCDAPPGETELATYFDGQMAVGSRIAEGAAFVFTDFRRHDDGASRFLILDRGLTPRQAGRTAQRLFEIEAYRMLALLALPIARRQGARIVAIEKSLALLTDGIGRDDPSGKMADEQLLTELTRLAAEVESGLAASQFRFGACRAYAELVKTRINDLREERLPGVQTIGEFMARRFEPAVATCATVSQRLHNLSERVAQATGLLSTRVDITRERQNQALLASMDRRAKLQLRLQQTVEGLSLAAIVYYGVGLVGYLAKGVKAAGFHIDPELVTGIAVPVLLIVGMFTLRRVHRRIAREELRDL